MAPPTPRYLFRVWTDQSNGTNSPTQFESAWRTWSVVGIFADLTPAARYRELKKRYQGALMGKEVDANPYVFTTCSLLYAIQHAIAKTRGNNDTNANITCIDTDTCKRADGQKVRFYSAVGAMSTFTMATPRARWTYEQRNYSDVWVTTDRIMPEEGSYYVPFDKLKEIGLFKLYPEFAVINRSHNPGLESPVNDLRRHWYPQKRDLPLSEFTLAAQLAAAFRPVAGGTAPSQVPNHLLAWFVGLKAQRPDGKRLLRWLNSHDAQPAPALVSTGANRPKSAIPELDRFHQIYTVVERYNIAKADVKVTDVRIGRDRLSVQADDFKDSRKRWKGEIAERERSAASRQRQLRSLVAKVVMEHVDRKRRRDRARRRRTRVGKPENAKVWRMT